MKPGDLIRHLDSGDMAIVLCSRMSQGTLTDSIYNYIDLVWLDGWGEDSAYAGLFEVISEVR
jgi:hypothetical protein